MSTNTAKAKSKLKQLIRRKKKASHVEREPSDGQIVVSLKVPTLPTSKPDINQSDSNKTITDKKKGSRSKLNSKKNTPGKKQSRRFSEGREVEDQVLRSPSRLGYREEIPIIVEGSWENTSQDSNREDFNFLDLKDITTDQDQEPHGKDLAKESLPIETRESGQQTDFPVTPTTPALPSSERKEPRSAHFVSSHKFLLEKGSSPKNPYEKTVFFVKSSQNGHLSKTASPGVTYTTGQSRTSKDINRTVSVSPPTRVDSGYDSHPETIRIPASPSKSRVPPYSDRNSTTASSRYTSPGRHITRTINDRNISYDSNRVNSDSKTEVKSPIMNFYGTDIISPMSSARKQEKEDLQMLNERFSTYIQKVRLLSEQNNRLDASTFVKQTRILEEEVANLKTLYERELDAIRQELNAVNREKSNYQLQCEKNKQAAIDFESRMAVETDKNRRLMDDINQLQQKNNSLETELMNIRQAGDGRSDFMHLQREMDKIIRENEDHKRRQEQESLIRTEAEDRCHTLTKKLEFNEQVHAQQIVELRERFEQSQALVISLESRLSQAIKNDIAIPEVLKQVREQAEHELKRYQLESEENYTRNISALKCQMDNDAHNIERLSSEKSQLQGQIGELNAKIRNLEGQVMTLEHQRGTVEDLIKQERDRSSQQLQEMNLKLHDMQELVFTKMREASSERDLHVPLKAEIEAIKILLEEEERRLQLRLPMPFPVLKGMNTSPLLKVMYTSHVLKEMNTSPVLKEMNTSPLLKGMNTSPVLKEIDTSPVLKGMNTSPVLKGMNINPVLKEMNTSPVLKVMNTSPVLKGMNTNPVLKGMNTSPVLKGMNTSPVLKEMNTSPGMNTSPVLKGMNTSPVLKGMDTSQVLKEMNTSPVLKGMNISPVLKLMNTSPVLKEMSISPVLKGMNTSTVLMGMNTSPVLKGMNMSPILKGMIISPIINFNVIDIDIFKSSKMKIRQPTLLMYSDNLKFIKKDNVIRLAKLRQEVCPGDEIVIKPLRLQLPITATHPLPQTFSTGVPLTLPAVSAPISQPQPDYVSSPTQLHTATENAFATQSSAYTQQYGEQTSQGEPLFTHVPMQSSTDPGSTDFIGASKYTYETSPSLNRLQIDSPPRTSPRAIGPISRAKSAPVRPGSSVQVVPTKLGQGKDYFDEMFRDLTRETLYTQTRPKSSPMERPPSAKQRERPSSRSEFLEMVTQQQPILAPSAPEMTEQVERPRSAASDRVDPVPEPRPADRPQSSVFHDYTTSTSRIEPLKHVSSAVGDIKILEVNQDGKFIRLFNEGKQEIEFGGYMIQQNVGGHPVAVFRFPPRTKFAAECTITIWSGSQDPIEHQPPKDFVWREQQKWGTGPECTTILCKPNGQAIAWMTAAHRFTKNLYEDSLTGSPTEQAPIPDTGVPMTSQDEILTEMNVNLNEPKPEPVYLAMLMLLIFREKQSPPSLNAQKHPHGTSPGKDTHPHIGQPRPFTYGNDNSSVNRQSRVQSTRPDPIPGQPYAGGSATRIGSAPLRKYKSTASTGTIRGSGGIANRSEPGMTSEPPNPFQTPHRRFEKGMEQIQSQHHVSFNPPMPRPPLFSTW
ncbi:uncharacterized protein LOC123536790 [Mercenaria mercenaria]|uniref:uncharacterized protein LOC123536790 n=1 Tax=Mercenaria mercenaria TaxID=6596 RepID=UPI00234EEACE|nr:uncharacterized protein LOC123536790 [Mercenaria mercenaria]